LLAAMLVALWRELRDDRLREPEQLAQAAGVPFVMAVATSRNRSMNSGGQAYAGLVALYPRLRRILVTAASAGDQARIGAERLAAIAAEAGQEVRVVAAEAYHERPPSEPLEVTLVAAPSPDISARAVMLARSSDVAVVVATTGVTHFGAAERTAALLRRAGTDVAAAILLPPTSTAGRNGKGREL
jgi:Mrp family chromosome partitioning ATPase